MAERTDTAEDASPRGGFRSPSALTVLLGVTLVVWLLALVIPTGAYEVSEKTGGPVPGTYHHVGAGVGVLASTVNPFATGVASDAAGSAGAPEPMTGRQKRVLAAVVATFAFMIFAIVPWAQIFQGPSAESYPWQLDWYFPSSPPCSS